MSNINKISDCMTSAEIALDKGLILLAELTYDYVFYNEPTLAASNLNKEASTWLWDYRRIMTFINMIQDYSHETMQHIKQAIELGGEQEQ